METTENKNEVKHTPTPWRQINGAIFDTTPWRLDQRRNTVPALFIPSPQQQDNEINKGNAAFIVRAVNSHEALLDAVKSGLLALESGAEPQYIKDKMRKAIAQAEGK